MDMVPVVLLIVTAIFILVCGGLMSVHRYQGACDRCRCQWLPFVMFGSLGVAGVPILIQIGVS